MRIKTQIFISFIILTSLGYYFFVDWVVGDIKPHYRESTEDPLVDASTVLAALAGSLVEKDTINVNKFREAYADIAKRSIAAQIYDFLKTSTDLRIYITNKLGVVLFDSRSGQDEGKDYSSWRDVRLTLAGQYGARTSRDSDKPDQSVLYVAAPIYSEGEIVGVLTVAKPTANTSALMAAAQKRIIKTSILVFLLVAALGLWLSNRLSTPIQRLTDYARSVRDNKRSAFPYLGKSEIAELGIAFEEMRETLEGKNYIEHYVQTLTHELKSPLSGIHAAAELLQSGMPPTEQAHFINNILNDSSRIQQLVEKMLLLSSLQTRRKAIEASTFSAQELLSDLKNILESQMREKHLELEMKHSETIGPITADRFLLQQALLNLLQNAIDFTTEGQKISLSVNCDYKCFVFVVEDSGSGIPSYAIGKVFDSFFSLQRPATGRKSSGLGLSLVKEVAELHGGEIVIENRSSGGVRAVLSIANEGL